MPERNADELGTLLVTGDHALLDDLLILVREDADAMSAAFYDELLADPEAGSLLDEELVGRRLRSAWAHWLEQLFGVRTWEQIDELVAYQRTIGKVHARLDIPLRLVGEAMRIVREELGRRWVRAATEDRHTPGLLLITAVLDHANSIMTAAYVASTVEDEREATALREQLQGTDLALAVEGLRTDLFRWYAKVLRAGVACPGPLANSDVGLWVRHRAPDVGSEADHRAGLLDQVALVDERHRRCISDPGGRPAPRPDPQASCWRELDAAIVELDWQLGEVAQRARDDDAARDPLTQLLSRRLLAPALRREARLSTRFSRPFALLVCDLDRFKAINDRHGHAAGDEVLRRFAEVLRGSARPSDLVFRLGGEEFLVVAVETDERTASTIADRLLQRVRQTTFTIGTDHEVEVTASIGVAVHDGHLDHERTLRSADRALYLAKERGRDRAVVAGYPAAGDDPLPYGAERLLEPVPGGGDHRRAYEAPPEPVT